MSKELDIETLTRPGGIVPVNLETTAALVRLTLRMREALLKIGAGSFPGASTLAVEGQWQKFAGELQTIAQTALIAIQDETTQALPHEQRGEP